MNSSMRILRKIYNISIAIISTLIISYALLVAGGLIFGLKTYAVCSPSMHPTFNTGDMLYVKKVDPQEVRVGDPITFEFGNNSTVTHRVVQIDLDEQCFYTKGDNNNSPDGTPVPFSSLKGVPIFSIPYIGIITYYIQNTPWKYLVISISIAILLLLLIPSDQTSKDKSTKEEQNIKLPPCQ